MKKIKIGVVIARFQTHKLHRGHTHVLDIAEQNSDTLCVLLGEHGGVPTDHDPLDFSTRKAMVLEVFNHAVVLKVRDCISHEAWSKEVDKILTKEFPEAEITLYGSRDSFISYYSGILETKIVEEVESVSATELRSRECFLERNNEDFRAGIVYASINRFPLVYMTVDVAVIKKVDNTQYLLVGRKKGDGSMYRLIGGFVDPKDESVEAAAKRELLEEAGTIQTSPFKYVCSSSVSDFRYRLSKDSVITTLFIAEYISGKPYAMDDLDEVAWMPLLDAKELVISAHRHLIQKVIDNLLSNS
jgi:bifunctional NMN adenylyltransferase/nudix hydrolase